MKTVDLKKAKKLVKKHKKKLPVIMPDLNRSGEVPPKNESLADLVNVVNGIRGPLIEKTLRTVMAVIREKRLRHQNNFWRRHYGNDAYSYMTKKSEVPIKS